MLHSAKKCEGSAVNRVVETMFEEVVESIKAFQVILTGYFMCSWYTEMEGPLGNVDGSHLPLSHDREHSLSYMEILCHSRKEILYQH